MPDATKRCPQCGQRTTDLKLAECPYCRVALVMESGPQTAGLTPGQARAVARQLLGSWKLWAILILLVGAAAWGVVQISQKVIDRRTKEYMSAWEEKATNRLAIASAQISKQVSNQIESEIKQSRIQSAVEQMAKEQVNEALTNSIWPSLQEFQLSMNLANRQLAKSANELAKLDKDIKAAERKAAQAQAAMVAPAVVATAPASVPTAAVTNAASASAGGTSKLVFASQTVSPNGPNYILTVFFKQTSSNPIGPVTLTAATLTTTLAKIVGFGLLSQEPSQPMILNDTKDAAQLSFTVTGGDAPIVAVEVTAPTIVQITGDALASDLMLPVAAEKMVLPSAAR